MSHAERLLISAVLRERDPLTPLAHGVTVDWFVAHPHEWEWIVSYSRSQGRSPDLPTFRAAWPEFQVLKAENPRFLVEELRSEFTRRRLIEAGNNVVSRLKAGEPAAQVLDGTTRLLRQITVETSGSVNESDIVADASLLLDEAHRRWWATQETGLAGVATGWPTIDGITGGLGADELWVIQARLGVGKTNALVKIATEAAMAGKTVVIDSLEQSRSQIGFRLCAFLGHRLGADIKAVDLQQGRANIDMFRQWLLELPGKVPGKILVDDTPRGKMSPGTIAAQIERHQPDLVLVDYIQLLSPPRADADWQLLAEASSALKGLAHQYHLPVVVAAQARRDAAGRAPGNEDLARSDAIGQDADLVIGMHDPGPLQRSLRITKNRHGATGARADCEFRPGIGIFDEVDAVRWQTLAAEAVLQS